MVHQLFFIVVVNVSLPHYLPEGFSYRVCSDGFRVNPGSFHTHLHYTPNPLLSQWLLPSFGDE
jgi:hypothetical protein